MYVCFCGKEYRNKRDFTSHFRLSHVKNPMELKKTREQVGSTLRQRYKNGEIIPYASTKEGKEHLRIINRERMLKNNPMKNPLVSKRQHNTLQEKYKHKPHPNKGKKRPDVSERLSGKKLSKKTRDKISKAKVEYYKTHDSPYKGKKSPIARKRILENNPMWDSEVVKKNIKVRRERGTISGWAKPKKPKKKLTPKQRREIMKEVNNRPEKRRLLSKRLEDHYQTKKGLEQRGRYSLRMLKENPMNNPVYGENWKIGYEEYRRNIERPNKKERKLMEILQPFGFKYNKGEFRIGRKFPDFVRRGTDFVVDLFGDHWHESEEEKERIEYFKEHRYNLLIIWEHELKNQEGVVERVINFLGGKE